jgi:15-cis-phytoene synthase
MITPEQKIFKKSSTTYYWTSRFFPKSIRQDVFRLYSFVRIIDDYVDNIPPQTAEFIDAKTSWQNDTKSTHAINSDIIKTMKQLQKTYDLDPKWTDSFLDSMQMDLDQKIYTNIQDTLDYIYGSAEVIGLYMSQIIGLPEASHATAQLQGRSMQMINFIRDIAEDLTLGRQYFPSSELAQFGLSDLSKHTTTKNPKQFVEFVEFQIDRYLDWQRQAEAGYKYIPKRLLVPIKTASDLYCWTGAVIRKDPQIVYLRRVKPTKLRVLLTLLKNYAVIYTRTK